MRIRLLFCVYFKAKPVSVFKNSKTCSQAFAISPQTSSPSRSGHGNLVALKKKAGGEEGGMERWLLTYADMITLLMALFMVLFSISSVNISKYKSLQRSLQDAFSGKVLKGGDSILNQGAANTHKQVPSSAAVVPATVLRSF